MEIFTEAWGGSVAEVILPPVLVRPPHKLLQTLLVFWLYDLDQDGDDDVRFSPSFTGRNEGFCCQNLGNFAQYYNLSL